MAKVPASHGTLSDQQLRAVAGLFSALAEPSRLQLLQALQNGPASVGELVERTGMKQANVSKQLSLLAGAGIIARASQGNRAIYSIQMPLVFDLCGLVCGGIADFAIQRAKALRGSRS